MTLKNRRKTDPDYVEGMALVNAMIRQATTLEIDKYKLSETIGITYPYLCAITNGTRPVGGISHDKLRSIAKFLDMTFVQVLMLAEIVKPQDFLKDQGQELERSMLLSMESMRMHHEWGGVTPTPEEWNALSEKTRVGFALMWQQISGQTMLNQAQMIMVSPDNEEADVKIKNVA